MFKKIYNLHKETIHNLLWRTIQIIGKQGIVFLIFILCAKLLSPYDFGIYNYVLAVIFILIMFGDFGISTATSKYVAEYNIIDKEKLKYVLFNSAMIILGLTIFISFLTFIIGPWYLKDKYIYILYLLPLIFLAPMTSLYDGIYRGLKKFKQLSVISVIVGVLAIPMVYYFVKIHGLIGALIAQNIFYFVFLLTLGFCHKEIYFKINKSILREIGKYSLIVGLANFGYLFYTRIDIIILGQFGHIVEIGYYEIVNKILQILITPFLILGQVIAPNIIKKFSFGECKKIINKYKLNTPIIFGIGIFISLVLFFIMPFIFPILFSEYDSKLFFFIFNFILFLIPFKILGFFNNNSFIISAGKAKIITYPLIIGGVINIFLDLYFIKLNYLYVIYSTYIINIISIIVTQFIFYNYLLKISKNINKCPN
jgi:PST family polysaccharide transporter